MKGVSIITNNSMPFRYRLIVHTGIAVLSALALGLQDYKSLSEITDINLVLIIVNCAIQGLNACKALYDTSFAKLQEEQDSESKQTEGK